MGVLRLGVDAHTVRAARGSTELAEVELPLRGRSVVTAYPGGLIPRLMALGMSFQKARCYAERFVVYRCEVGNLIVTAGKVLVCRMLMDDGAQWDVGLTYHAIGTDDTAPALSDTQLGAEASRKAITSKSRSGNDITLSTFYPAADCTYAIEECGVFGSSTASATANSGELFSHYLQSYDSSAGDYDLTFDYVLTVG